MPNDYRTILLTGRVYQNRTGAHFHCIAKADNGYLVQCVETGWTQVVVGIWQHENGAIHWDYSYGGHFAEEASK